MPPKAKISKEQIIDAATELVGEEGMSALTARALCKRLNCSVSPIFTLFKNMEEVQSAVIVAAKQEYKKYLYDGLKNEIPFKGVGVAYIRFSIEKPKLFKLLFMSDYEIKNSNNLLPTLDDNYDAILNSVKLSYGVTDDTALTIYKHLFVYTHGIATMCATGTCIFGAQEIGEMLSLVCRGILKQLGVI